MRLTLKKRLAMYQQALKDYQKENQYNCKGFCYYFNKKYGTYSINYYFEMDKILPELYATFVNKCTAGVTYMVADNTYGPTPRRIQCLKIAIKEVKLIIKNAKKS